MSIKSIFKKDDKKKETSSPSPTEPKSSSKAQPPAAEKSKGGAKKASEKKSSQKKSSSKSDQIVMAGDYDKISVIKHPSFSEKSHLMSVNHNQYVFWVLPDANKSEIKKEVEKRWNVKVESVNIVRKKTRPKRYGRWFGRRHILKKAIVKISLPDKLDIYQV